MRKEELGLGQSEKALSHAENETIVTEDMESTINNKIHELTLSFKENPDIDKFFDEATPLLEEIKTLQEKKEKEAVKRKQELETAKKEGERSLISSCLFEVEDSLQESENSPVEIERTKRYIENLKDEKNLLDNKEVRLWNSKSWKEIQEAEEDAKTETGKEKFRKDRNEAWCNLKDLEGATLEEFEKSAEEAEINIKTSEENFEKAKKSWNSLPDNQKDEVLNLVRASNSWKLRWENLKLAVVRKKVLG